MGDKGQKGDSGSPGFDVFSAVKVNNKIAYEAHIFFIYKYSIAKSLII